MTSPLDTDHRLAAEKRRAMAWVLKHWKSDNLCPICGARRWVVGDVVQLQPLVRMGYPATAEVFPMFPFVCGTCGYTMLFNALISGVIERPNTDHYGFPRPVSGIEPSGE